MISKACLAQPKLLERRRSPREGWELVRGWQGPAVLPAVVSGCLQPGAVGGPQHERGLFLVAAGTALLGEVA